jgi:hypothetical protein
MAVNGQARRCGMSDPDPGTQVDPDQGADGGAPPPEDPTEALKRENAQLRERNRSLNAKALAAQHGFADKTTAVEMLATVPIDQQEAKAQALAAEIGGAPPPAPQPPAEPANAGDIAAMGGAPPAAAGIPGHPPDPGDELNKRLQGAGSFEEMQEIQRQERMKRMGETSL